MSTKTRLWVLVTGILCVLVVLYGLAAGFLPQLTAASQTRSEAQNVEFIVETQQLQLERLEQADRESSELARQLAELELAIPTDPEWAEFLRELQRIQSETGAVVSQISVQASILPEAAGPTAEEVATGEGSVDGSAADGTAADGTTSDGSASDSTASTDGTAPATSLTQIPLTITLTGAADQVAEFVRQLQVGGRLFTSTNFEMDSAGETTTGTITGTIYVAP